MKSSNKKSRTGRILTGSVLSTLAIATVFAGTLATSSVASASATGCQFRSGFNVGIKGVNVPIPGGNLCHRIVGSGKHIKQQNAAYNANLGRPGLTCNWRIDFVYKDTNGRTYKTDRGRTQRYCNVQARRYVSRDKHLPRYGKSCAILYLNGKSTVTQCHNITRGFKLW